MNDTNTLPIKTKPRARDLGLPLSGRPGPLNAITDVAQVAVGLCNIIEDSPRTGRPLPLRTGVTAIIPRTQAQGQYSVFAGLHRFNGNGEMTGTHWIEDSGLLNSPILITNTHNVGIVHQAAVKWMLERFPGEYGGTPPRWLMPVVAETYDGILNDINALGVTEEMVFTALDGASTGPVAEGNTGGGTSMIAYGFKAGTGTASRVVQIAGHDYTVGVLVQANHGQREWLTICGVPVGRDLAAAEVGTDLPERGSIIVVIATDIPMAPHQLRRLARRGTIGIGRGGTPGGNSSGDIFLAFSTANEGVTTKKPLQQIEMLDDELFDPVYLAAVESVDEAILNSMLAAEDMAGTIDGRAWVRALPHDILCDIMRWQRPFG